MKLLSVVVSAAILAASAPALADEAVAPAAVQSLENLRTGRLVISAEGNRLGRIESMIGDRAAPTAVRVIINSRLVSIPTSTLSPSDRPNVFKTSLSFRDLR